NVAAEYGLTTLQQHELTLVRYKQYEEALENDNAFLKRFMTLPFSVPDARFKREQVALNGDEGIFPTTQEGLTKLKPLIEGGTVTFGGQTHPADGNAGMLLTTADRAADFSKDRNIGIRI